MEKMGMTFSVTNKDALSVFVFRNSPKSPEGVEFENKPLSELLEEKLKHKTKRT